MAREFRAPDRNPLTENPRINVMCPWIRLAGLMTMWLTVCIANHASGQEAANIVILQAEQHAAGGRIAEAPGAMDGKAVTHAKAWNPVFSAKVPALGEGYDSLTIWIRHRSGSLQLKVVVDGKQQDRNWIKNPSDEWKWTRVGRFPRPELGESLLFIRGSGESSPQLDAVVLVLDDGFDPKTLSIPVDASPEIPGKPTIVDLDKGPTHSIGAPAGLLIEAESARKSGKVIDDAQASGGKAVTHSGAWQPLFAAPLPAGSDELTLWIRYKDGPIQLKKVVDGKQSDMRWLFEAPGAYKWATFGRFSRDELGESIVVIRGGAGKGDPKIDCVVFASDAGAVPAGMSVSAAPKVPPPFAPDDAAAPVTVRLSLDWKQTVAPISRDHWGVCDYEVLDPKAAANAGLQEYLASLKPSLIRIHHAGLSDRWTDAQAKDWDIEKIRQGLSASTGYGDARLIINIPTWPKWMAPTNKPLPTELHQPLADLIARLVVTLRDDLKKPGLHWEVLNETENMYEKADKLPEMWALLNTIATTIKRVDPKAKVGGPALTWPKPQWVDAWVEQCGANMDFITWHNYASGDVNESNASVFAKADTLAGYAKRCVDVVARKQPGKKMETFLTEMNVKWTWDPFERRHANNVGAVFQASVVKRMALAGVTGMTVWHAKGNAYGLIDADNRLRATGRIYQIGSNELIGIVVGSTTHDATLLEALPVIRADGSRAVLLLCKADRTVNLPEWRKALGIASNQALQSQRIDAKTMGTVTLTDEPDGSLKIPGYSATLLILPLS